MTKRGTRAASAALSRLRAAHDRKARAIEGLLAAMEAAVADASGDMTDADCARLWNAAVDEAEAALGDQP